MIDSAREELTDEERAVICGTPSLATLGDAGAKVLRIIDACDARINQLTEALAAAGRSWEADAAALAINETSRAEAAEARVRELEAALANNAGYDAWMRAAKELGAELDAANALLHEWRTAKVTDEWINSFCERVDAQLSAQPAAPRVGFDYQPGSPGYCDGWVVCQSPAPTDHDRAVLEAAEAWHDADINDPDPSDEALHAAVIARREAKCG